MPVLTFKSSTACNYVKQFFFDLFLCFGVVVVLSLRCSIAALGSIQRSSWGEIGGRSIENMRRRVVCVDAIRTNVHVSVLKPIAANA